jgi:hypothetical protein
MKRAKSKKLLKLTKTQVVLLVVLLILLGAGAWALSNKDDNKKIPTASPGSAGSSQSQQPNGASPNLSPPTSQERKDTETHKDSLTQNQTPQGKDSGKSAVVTSASGAEVRALVSGVVEDGGTCTFVFTKGSETIAKTSSGVANVSTTNCVLYSPAPSSYLSSGSWTVSLSYTSSSTSVKSSPYSFTR